MEFRDNIDLESDKASPSGTPDLILLSADVFHGTGVWSDTGDGGVPVRGEKDGRMARLLGSKPAIASASVSVEPRAPAGAQ